MLRVEDCRELVQEVWYVSVAFLHGFSAASCFEEIFSVVGCYKSYRNFSNLITYRGRLL